MDDLNAHIGDYLREARFKTGMPQSTVAQSVGLTSGSISNIESGRHRLNIDLLVKLCHALSIDTMDVMDHVLTGRPTPHPIPIRHLIHLRDALQDAHAQIGNLLGDLHPITER